MPWTHLENKELYAFWIDETLSFTLTKVNGNSVYAVSKGSRIDLVTELTVPATYRGLPVAFVAGILKNTACLAASLVVLGSNITILLRLKRFLAPLPSPDENDTKETNAQ